MTIKIESIERRRCDSRRPGTWGLKGTLFFFPMLLVIGIPQCTLLDEQLQVQPVVSTNPASRNSVLEAEDTISVRFSSQVECSSAEPLLQVNSLSGPVSGRHNWNKRTLEFLPQVPLERGVRYTLKLQGTVQLENGRDCPLNTVIPFYYLEKSETSHTSIRYTPQNGSSLDKNTPVQITFPSEVDPAETAQDLQLTPLTPCSMEWNESSTCLTLSPEEGWARHTVYSIEFLSRSYPPAYYLSEYDLPDIIQLELSPVFLDWVEDFPVSESELTELQQDETFQVTFSEIVNQEEFEASFFLDPLCGGSFYWKDLYTAVYIPDNTFSPSTRYVCKIEPYSAESILNSAVFISPTQFTTAEELPEILGLHGASEDSFPDSFSTLNNSVIEITPVGPDGLYNFTIEYAQGIVDEEIRGELQKNTSITTLFPPDLPSPRIISFVWPDSYHLLIQVQGFGAQAESRDCYYSFSLPETPHRRRSIKLRVSS